MQVLRIETALLGRWENDAKGRVSYTFVEARDGETDAILVSSPKHLAKFNFIYPVIEKSLLYVLC